METLTYGKGTKYNCNDQRFREISFRATYQVRGQASPVLRVVNDIVVSRATSLNLIIFLMSVKCLMFLLTYSSCSQKYVAEIEIMLH